MSGLRSVEEHLDDVLRTLTPLATRVVPVAEALGAVLRTDAHAAVPVPVFDNSAMDGFAVRFDDVAAAASDNPIELSVVADLPAGSAADPPLRPGEAARIMTGSAVPTDADAIVPFEHTRGGLESSLSSALVLRAPAARGAHIRRRGEDLETGDLLLPAGVRIGPFQAGALAAAGVAEVTVSRAPRVAVLSTGSELAVAGSVLDRGMIPESNSILLAGLAVACGAVLVHRDSVPDHPSALQEAIGAARTARADVVVFSGGVSAGAYEVVKQTLGDGRMDFVQVAMQPGKPQGFGRTEDGVLLFGLPGNPVSAAVSFEVFVRPALLGLQGRLDGARAHITLPAATSWRTPPGRRQYLPATIDRTDPQRWSVRPATAGGSGSHLAGGLGRAEAYAVVPAEVERVQAGDPVTVLLVQDADTGAAGMLGT